MITFMSIDTGLQVPFPEEVNVNTTTPAITSAAEGLYLAFKIALFGVKFPEPEVLHNPPVALNTEPFNVTPVTSEHILAPPVLTIGAGVMVVTIESFTALHVPLPVDVTTKVTVPAVVSPADNV